MRFRELFEQFGKPVAFRVPSKIANMRPKPDYRQQKKFKAYQVMPTPAFTPSVDVPDIPPVQVNVPSSAKDPLIPLRIGKEIIRPKDPRYAAIMRLLNKQKGS